MWRRNPIRRKVRLALGDSYNERGALSRGALGSHGAAMKLDQFLHKRQADPSALVSATARVLHSIKPLEDVRDLFRSNSNPGITNRQLDGIGQRPHGDGDLALESKFESVRHQVKNDLFPHATVYVDGFAEWRAVNHEAQSGAFTGRAKVARQLGSVDAEVRRLVRGLNTIGLDAREVEQRVNELE